MAKAIKTAEEILQDEQEQYEIRHKKKHDDLDKMIRRQQHKAMRMERINPRTAEHPDLTPEEVEEIEKELPVDFTDEQMEEVINSKGLNVKREERRKEREENFNKHKEDIIDAITLKDNQNDIPSP